MVNNKNVALQEKPLAKEKEKEREREKERIYLRQNTFEVNRSPSPSENIFNDEGLFIIARGKIEGAEIYAISDFNKTLKILPKYHINIEKINIETVKVLAIRDRIYFTFAKDQRLVVKSWNFKRQTMLDVLLPAKVQTLKPRLTNAVGESFYILEEKFTNTNWSQEGNKTTICKFGLDTESYKCMEFNGNGIKEIIGIGNDVFTINAKGEVFSFTFGVNKKISRGILNHNGIPKAVVFHGNIYVGCYIRAKCTLFVEQYKRKTNQWATVSNSHCFGKCTDRQ